MSDARTDLLARVVDDVADHGLTDRSLRELAQSIGTSHRMLLYHFGSRAGLVEAVVAATEQAQREMLLELAAEARSPEDLVRALWRQVSSPELRPFVRLFFECVGASGGTGLTQPWLEVSAEVGTVMDEEMDPDQIRLGVAVTRGLLIDVLATGDTDAATRSLEQFIATWLA